MFMSCSGMKHNGFHASIVEHTMSLWEKISTAVTASFSSGAMNMTKSKKSTTCAQLLNLVRRRVLIQAFWRWTEAEQTHQKAFFKVNPATRRLMMKMLTEGLLIGEGTQPRGDMKHE